MEKIKKDDYEENIKEIDNFCEECKKEDKSCVTKFNFNRF